MKNGGILLSEEEIVEAEKAINSMEELKNENMDTTTR